MSKLRRNAACPCGSGEKYKKCHGAPFSSETSAQPLPHIGAGINQKMKEINAQNAQREKQQGFGHPIVACKSNDHRIVAVGNKLYFSKQWQTFHDFLRYFFFDALGQEWLKLQALLPLTEQHLVFRWHEQAMQDLTRLGKKVGDIYSAPMTGVARAFLNLAYNIYLIRHHTTDNLIMHGYVSRLKSADPGNVTGALFETYAAAAFLKAGFTLEFEGESGKAVSHSHGEFVATYPTTGKKFSVEVKAKERSAIAPRKVSPEQDNIKRLRVGDKLRNALKKEVTHPRVVLIEVNVPDVLEPSTEKARQLTGWQAAALKQIRYQETTPFADGRVMPSAYVIVTNHAFHNNLEAMDMALQAFSTGFKIEDFCPDVPFKGYYAALQARERHSEIFALLQSLKTHYEIPATFDGEIPELAFGEESQPRLQFGRWYNVPTGDGREIPGRLYNASVDEARKQVIGAYQLSTGQHVLARSPISDAELAAFRRFPETFFGEIRPVNKPTTTIEELCDFFFENHKQLSKEQLLEALKQAPDYERLLQAEQKELAAIYAERCALHVFRAA
ncbi:MAG: YecA family protein [Methylocella sp.]